jgi:glucose-6-phosphate isomerase
MTGLEEPWDRVLSKAARLKPWHIRDLFAGDQDRFGRFSTRLDDLLIDYSKEKIDADGMAALFDLARAAQVEARRDAMISGARINATEGRAVLHTALRGGAGEAVVLDGADVMPEVRATLGRFLGFAEDLRARRYLTAAGVPFTDVINIGIGGSDLGPAMAVQALAPYHDGPRVHFVSNVDGSHLDLTTSGLDPARTLVIVASKTFTTLETMTNARTARDWLAGALGAEAGRHMAAVSTNLDATRAFGIGDDRVFGFWDWVGGRYSVWSAIGLPLAIAIGAEGFRAFLGGARGMDAHFRAAPLERNLPVLLALIGIWRRNAMGWPGLCVAPYDQRLARFPAYLQQLDMESNGKRVQADGTPVAQATAPVVWGEPGTNGQHSFFQLLHQGTDVVPVDFILAAEPHRETGDHHAKLAANALAQAAALAFGKTEDAVRAELAAKGVAAAEIDRLAPHRSFPGDRPSTTILFHRLDPASLGRLIALYEHKVFVQGAIWGVNSFDQWGVELGKDLAAQLLPAVTGDQGAAAAADASTAGLIAHFQQLRGG